MSKKNTSRKKQAKNGGKKTPAPVFVAEGVAKSYGDLVALHPMDLSVAPGEWIALVGHNGSGKSTLLKLAAGLLDATEGSIQIADHPVGSLEAKRALCYVPDTPVLYDDLSVLEHAEYLGRLNGVTDWSSRADELIERFGLTQRADDLPRGFSRGLRQKTSLVVALLRQTAVLLIDEPFSGLDQTGKAALLEIVEERREAGTAVVLATHDLDVVSRAERGVVLREGHVERDGHLDPSEVATLAG